MKVTKEQAQELLLHNQGAWFKFKTNHSGDEIYTGTASKLHEKLVVRYKGSSHSFDYYDCINWLELIDSDSTNKEKDIVYKLFLSDDPLNPYLNIKDWKRNSLLGKEFITFEFIDDSYMVVRKDLILKIQRYYDK